MASKLNQKDPIWNHKQIASFADHKMNYLDEHAGALEEQHPDQARKIYLKSEKDMAKWRPLAVVAHNGIPEPTWKHPIKAYRSSVVDGSLAKAIRTTPIQQKEKGPMAEFTGDDVDDRNKKLFKFSKAHHDKLAQAHSLGHGKYNTQAKGFSKEALYLKNAFAFKNAKTGKPFISAVFARRRDPYGRLHSNMISPDASPSKTYVANYHNPKDQTHGKHTYHNQILSTKQFNNILKNSSSPRSLNASASDKQYLQAANTKDANGLPKPLYTAKNEVSFNASVCKNLNSQGLKNNALVNTQTASKPETHMNYGLQSHYEKDASIEASSQSAEKDPTNNTKSLSQSRPAKVDDGPDL